MEEIIATTDDLTEFFASLKDLLATTGEDERNPETEEVAKVASLPSLTSRFRSPLRRCRYLNRARLVFSFGVRFLRALSFHLTRFTNSGFN